jgi:hypothetical protein
MEVGRKKIHPVFKFAQHTTCPTNLELSRTFRVLQSKTLSFGIKHLLSLLKLLSNSFWDAIYFLSSNDGDGRVRVWELRECSS